MSKMTDLRTFVYCVGLREMSNRNKTYFNIVEDPIENLTPFQYINNQIKLK